jgi:hypothetical protein
LKGKRATTHWGFAELFRKRYPEVDLRIEAILTDVGNLLCAGGAFSYIDLSLYLVERFCGFEVASQCGRSLLLDLGRKSQLPYAILEYQKQHQDEQILRAQNLIEKNYSQEVNLEALPIKSEWGCETLREDSGRRQATPHCLTCRDTESRRPSVSWKILRKRFRRSAFGSGMRMPDFLGRFLKDR